MQVRVNSRARHTETRQVKQIRSTGFLKEWFVDCQDALCTAGLAKVLGVSMPTVYTWLKQGRVLAYDLEAKRLILNQETLDWLRARANIVTPRGGCPGPDA